MSLLCHFSEGELKTGTMDDDQLHLQLTCFRKCFCFHLQVKRSLIGGPAKKVLVSIAASVISTISF